MPSPQEKNKRPPQSSAVRVNESSPSVQTHLGIIQGIINRMAGNSTSCKTWCISLVSAILVVVANKNKPHLIWIALLPIVLFAALDVFYLALENGFRDRYADFVEKLHTDSLVSSDLFSVSPLGKQNEHQMKSLRSFSVWGLYLPLLVMVVLARYFLLSGGV